MFTNHIFWHTGNW